MGRGGERNKPNRQKSADQQRRNSRGKENNETSTTSFLRVENYIVLLTNAPQHESANNREQKLDSQRRGNNPTPNKNQRWLRRENNLIQRTHEPIQRVTARLERNRADTRRQLTRRHKNC
ncbi:unnamed protein product [Ectocarpus sp. 8 AP-2014]